jgi:hypothetical protein
VISSAAGQLSSDSSIPSVSWPRQEQQFLLRLGAVGHRLIDGQDPQIHDLCGRPRPPKHRVRELWAIVDRRGGKDSIGDRDQAYGEYLDRISNGWRR